MGNIPHYMLVLTADKYFGHTLRTQLTGNGYEVQIECDLPHAVHAVYSKTPSLLIVDRRITDARHVLELDVFKKIRHLAVHPPELECEEDACVEEINQGFDFVICGESYRLILARIKAILRRKSEQAELRRRVIGRVAIDLDRYEVTVDGRPIELTRTQYKILELMVLEPMRALRRNEILDRVWGDNIAIQEHTLDVHIHALRKKIERDPTRPDLIKTIHGFGYRLSPPSLPINRRPCNS